MTSFGLRHVRRRLHEGEGDPVDVGLVAADRSARSTSVSAGIPAGACRARWRALRSDSRPPVSTTVTARAGLASRHREAVRPSSSSRRAPGLGSFEDLGGERRRSRRQHRIEVEREDVRPASASQTARESADLSWLKIGRDADGAAVLTVDSARQPASSRSRLSSACGSCDADIGPGGSDSAAITPRACDGRPDPASPVS